MSLALKQSNFAPSYTYALFPFHSYKNHFFFRSYFFSLLFKQFKKQLTFIISMFTSHCRNGISLPFVHPKSIIFHFKTLENFCAQKKHQNRSESDRERERKNGEMPHVSDHRTMINTLRTCQYTLFFFFFFWWMWSYPHSAVNVLHYLFHRRFFFNAMDGESRTETFSGFECIQGKQTCKKKKFHCPWLNKRKDLHIQTKKNYIKRPKAFRYVNHSFQNRIAHA